MNSILFEQFGGIYTRQGDYLLSNLTLPAEEKPVISECGDNAG